MGGKKLPSQIFNNMWMLDLSTLVWTMIWSPPNQKPQRISDPPPSPTTTTTTAEPSPIIPEPRYFHTASNYKNEALVIFGGLGPPEEESKGERCLDDLMIFDLATRTWRAPAPPSPTNTDRPPARYAHIAAISRDRLVIAGGELRYVGKKAYENLTDMHVFDFLSEKWVYKQSFGGADDHIGYYRSVMVSTPFTPRTYPVDNLEEETRLLETAEALYQQISASKISSSSEPSSPTQSFRSRSGSIESRLERRPSRGNLNSIPETESSEAEPYIYVYSTRQRTMRELSRLLMKLHSPQSENFIIEDYSSSLPPRGAYIPLRFPSGDIVGDWLIYCGTVPNEKPTDATVRQPGSTSAPLKPASFHILAIHLPTKQSKVIDVGNIFLSGSWNRGIVSPQRNSVIVFGNAQLDMTTDYTMRRANFNHVVLADIEVFGIYNVPKCQTATFSRGVAIKILDARAYSDMDIVTKEGSRIHVNSRILEHRWPMFTEVLNTCVYGVPYTAEQARRPSVSSSITMPLELRPTIPITERPRVLYLPLREEQTLAFLEYIYTGSLHFETDVPSACALLTLSKRFEPGLERLGELAADILHRGLNDGNAWQIIEAAAYAGRTGLQVKAMLVMRTAADLRLQAQRRRMELSKGKDGETNGTGMAQAMSSATLIEGAALESTGSNQSMESSQIIPPLAIEGTKAE
jgi:hypothetical protein